MSIEAGNAIGFLQVRLRGGWRNLATTGAVFGLAIVALMVASTHIDTRTPAAAVMKGWLPLLLGVQAALLFLAAGSRVTAAIRDDLNTRMIESHRLMPTGAGQAIFGYIAGSTSQLTLMAGLTFVIGIFATGAAGMPVVDWIAANAVLAAFCVATWAVLGYLSFIFRAPFVWVLALPAVSIFTEGRLWAILPPVTLFFSPLMGRSVFSLGSIMGPGAWVYMTSFLMQAAVAGIFFVAATRKYVRDDAIGLGPVLALGLLLVVAAATWIGIVNWHDVRPVWFRNGRRQNQAVQLIASLLMMMLLALLSVTAAARLRFYRQLDAARSDPEKPVRRGMPVILAVVLATAIIAGTPSALLRLPADQSMPYRWMHQIEELQLPWAATIALVLMSLTSFGYVIGIALRRGRSVGVTGVVWLGLTWIGPIVVDAMRDAVLDRPTRIGDGMMGTISICSPAGALIAAWQHAPQSALLVAVIVQIFLALATALIYQATPLKAAAPRSG